MKHEGTCSCSAVRISITAEPIMVFNCHCSNCRNFAGRYRDRPADFNSVAMTWRRNVVAEGPISYERTRGLGGLITMARGRCERCRDPVHERGERLAAPYAIVMAKQLRLEPDVNIFYDSGPRNGPDRMKTIHSDIGSLLCIIHAVLGYGISQLSSSISDHFGKESNKAD